MNTRTLILDKATQLLAESPTGDISTRAVCEAAGVGQPVLYRLFGDKNGLMVAIVDRVWGEYLAMKRAAEKSANPLDDLRRGWDAHTAFALAHPYAYRLIFGSALSTTPTAAAEAMGILRSILDRLAEQGRLRIAPEDAARIIMAANSGLALGLILHPETYPDLAISTITRDATFRAIMTDAEVSASDTADTIAVVAATTLRAHLAQSDLFTPSELGLLNEWLQRIQKQQAHNPINKENHTL
jgi:AcrR family transcriptional regulator